jgi:hypothetical protein
VLVSCRNANLSTSLAVSQISVASNEKTPKSRNPRVGSSPTRPSCCHRHREQMTKSNVIAVDFRPLVRNTNIDDLDAELDAIGAALEVAHSQARALSAEIRPLAGYTGFPMRWCRREPLR